MTRDFTVRHQVQKVTSQLGRILQRVKRIVLRACGLRSRSTDFLAALERVALVSLGDPIHPLYARGLFWNHFLKSERVHEVPATVISLRDRDGKTSHTEGGHFFPARRTYRVEECLVHKSSGLVFSHNSLVQQSVPLWSNGPIETIRYGIDDTDKIANIQPMPLTETIFPLPRGTTYNFYHFIVEYWTRILAAREIDSELHVSIAAKNPSSFIVDFLAVADVKAAQTNSRWIMPNQVLLSDHVEKNWLHPQDADRLRDFSCRVTRDYGYASDTQEKIYISRIGDERELTSEQYLADYLESQGFYIFRSSDHTSLTARMSLFAGARVVVGPYGAGLTHILWAKQGAHVLELVPESFFFRDQGEVYLRLATAAQHNYSREFLDCSQEPFGSGEHVQPRVRRWLDSI